MKKVHEDDFDYRFGDNGPKYLSKGPNIDIGVVVLKPGQDFPNHYHTTCEEAFYILEGSIDFYINNKRYPVKPGDMIQCSPGDSHYLINESAEHFKALFIKSPHIAEKDSIVLDKPMIKELKEDELGI
ncbi:cupin domain-containing protein [Peribacillus psychrosaccharolyticus]|uniref:Cupin domain-containing protein n=1 Tax=Peribacillus psychrosaccharolyticus TaxID=1407 RepID=A0A974NQ17_PERPY|nr:cupin domain-containing protein [Peribacillus psychrosaccharolyticus]MEC2055123.1 cupin domain-containing protein [Peribacillus psychrosaccharolyticus]MED3743825.1 cupin domain-containing protein [Peribacillus psychrosaccharolyticus]QQT01970.1 cupin domain-containing protein [Peribacillus psychrosaccharolyticus]